LILKKGVADITPGTCIKLEMKVYIKCNAGFSVLLLPLLKINEN